MLYIGAYKTSYCKELNHVWGQMILFHKKTPNVVGINITKGYVYHIV